MAFRCQNSAFPNLLSSRTACTTLFCLYHSCLLSPALFAFNKTGRYRPTLLDILFILSVVHYANSVCLIECTIAVLYCLNLTLLIDAKNIPLPLFRSTP